MIKRSEVIKRATTMWAQGSVPYSQNTIQQPTGYRQDCSGYVSMAWGIPPNENGGWGGQNTATLVTRGYMKEIPAADLKPGDAVGNCGPGSEGDAGHIVLFEKWFNQDPNNDDYYLLEQAGGVKGWRRRLVTYPYPGMGAPPWKAWRFVGIADDDQTIGGNTMQDFTPIAAPESIKLGGVTRGDSIGIWDNWGQEHFGHSPWDANGKSHRSLQLDRIEAFAKAAATGANVTFSPETIAAIATAVAAQIGSADVDEAELARQIILQLGGGAPAAQG